MKGLFVFVFLAVVAASVALPSTRTKRQVQLPVEPFKLVPNILPSVDVAGMVKGNGMTSSSSCDDKECIRKECIGEKCIKQRCNLNMEKCVPFAPREYLN